MARANLRAGVLVLDGGGADLPGYVWRRDVSNDLFGWHGLAVGFTYQSGTTDLHHSATGACGFGMGELVGGDFGRGRRGILVGSLCLRGLQIADRGIQTALVVAAVGFGAVSVAAALSRLGAIFGAIHRPANFAQQSGVVGYPVVEAAAGQF